MEAFHLMGKAYSRTVAIVREINSLKKNPGTLH